jgi:hypothetical protein
VFQPADHQAALPAFQGACRRAGTRGRAELPLVGSLVLRKAGATIRQEDLDCAIGNATATAGVFARRWLRWAPDYVTAALGAGIGR